MFLELRPWSVSFEKDEREREEEMGSVNEERESKCIGVDAWLKINLVQRLRPFRYWLQKNPIFFLCFFYFLGKVINPSSSSYVLSKSRESEKEREREEKGPVWTCKYEEGEVEWDQSFLRFFLCFLLGASLTSTSVSLSAHHDVICLVNTFLLIKYLL